MFSRVIWNARQTEKIGWTDCAESVSSGAVLKGTSWGRANDSRADLIGGFAGRKQLHELGVLRAALADKFLPLTKECAISPTACPLNRASPIRNGFQSARNRAGLAKMFVGDRPLGAGEVANRYGIARWARESKRCGGATLIFALCSDTAARFCNESIGSRQVGWLRASATMVSDSCAYSVRLAHAADHDQQAKGPG